MIIKSITLAFFTILFISLIATVLVFSAAPELSAWFESVARSALNYDAIPSPYTGDFFLYIFLNNAGHFWNPIRMIVWVPLVGPFLLGLEILLNGGIIGVVVVLAGMTRGILFPIIALTPHGIIEIPAFILQLSSIVLWQVTITEALVAKATGKKVERNKVKQGLKDTLVFTVVSIILLMIAAAAETYITPYLLGI